MKKILFILFFVFLSVQQVNSHPHVFVHTSVDAVFDDKGLAGFHVYWKFDEMFSNMFIFDFDKNMNRKFEPEELSALKKGGFNNLKKFDYFSHIKIENNEFKVSYVKDFTAWIKGSNLFYSFFIPCHVKALNKDKSLRIAIYDKSFYCSVFLTRNPLYIKDGERFETSYSIKKNEEESYYFNQIVPKEITLRFRLKNE